MLGLTLEDRQPAETSGLGLRSQLEPVVDWAGKIAPECRRMQPLEPLCRTGNLAPFYTHRSGRFAATHPSKYLQQEWTCQCSPPV